MHPPRKIGLVQQAKGQVNPKSHLRQERYTRSRPPWSPLEDGAARLSETVLG